MPRVIIGQLTTGRLLLDIPYLSYHWDSTVNTPERLSCTVSLADSTIRALGIRNAATAGKTFLAILDGDHVLAAGPMGKPSYGRKGRTVTLNADGMGEYLKRRRILPPNALTDPLFLAADLDADHKAGDPNPATNTVLSGWSLGTIDKKVIQQMMSWPGGAMPIVFQPDELGTHEDEIRGSDLKTVFSKIDDNSNLEGGPDWELRPRLTADRQGIEWQFLTGTEAQPRLASPSIHRWDYSVAKPIIQGLEVDIDSDEMTGLAWTTGGRSAGQALVAFARNTDLTDAGWPLYESADTNHATVEDQETLQKYSDEAIRIGAAPTEFWSFKVRTDQSPFVGEYFKGDYCDIVVKGDPFVPDGTYRRRIMSLSGDKKSKWITITTGEALSG